MDAKLPPPGGETRIDRPGRWTRVNRWHRWALPGILAIVAFPLLFAAWIGAAFLFQSSGKESGAVALNLVVTCAVAIAVLILMHRAIYRWYWHVDRRRAAGAIRSGDPEPRFGSEPTAPPPRIDWPWTLRLRHALFYLIGIMTLLYAFAPYDHQRAIIRFLGAHSAGRASAGSLATFVFGYLPMGVLMALAMALTRRQVRERDAGRLDARGRILLEAEVTWLFSFAAAYVTAMLLCRLLGGAIVAHL